MRRFSWGIPLVLATLGVAAGGGLVWLGQSEPARAPVTESVHTVSAIEVQAGMVSPTLRETGVVQPAQEVQLASRVNGPVVWVSPKLHKGTSVSAGEALARVDATSYESNVAEARSRVANAAQALALEQGKGEVVDLEQRLIGGELSDLARRAPQLAAAEAELEAARANLAKAERDLRDTVIRAPFDGLLVDESLEVGAYLGAGASVGRVVGTEAMFVELPVARSVAEQLDVPGLNSDLGSAAAVRVAGLVGDREAHVVGLTGQVDATTRNVTVLVAIDAPLDEARGPVVLPGTFVEVEMIGRQIADAVRLPEEALQDGGTVWTVDGEGRLDRIDVEVVFRDGDEILVRGLSDATVVIRTSALPLQGAPVVVEVAS